MIRKTTSEDFYDVIALAKANNFNANEIDIIQETLNHYLKGQGSDLWFIAKENEPLGVVYCTPERMTIGTWNILMILVHPNHQRKGYGKALINQVEEALVAQNARLLIVETSSLDDFAGARNFYTQCGFIQEGRIRNFYAPGDDKLILSKQLISYSKQQLQQL